MTEYCNICDTEISEGVKFCPQCGEKTAEQRAAESFTSQAKHYVGEAATEFVGAAKDTYQNGKHLADKDSAKKVAGGAAIGAVASVVAPIGILTGAAVGAGIVAYRHIQKNKEKEKK